MAPIVLCPLLSIACGRVDPAGAALPAEAQPALQPAAQSPTQSPAQAPAQPPQRPTAQRAHPLVVDPPKVDFGAVPPGARKSTTFTLRNPTGAPLKILDAKPSCKCTDITPMKGVEIPPGGSVELKATLAVPRTPGKKDAKVMIVVADFGMTVAQMEATATLPIMATPEYVEALRGVDAGEVTLAAADGAPFSIIGSWGIPAAEGDAAPKPSHALRWTTKDLAGPLPQWLVVATDRADCPLVALRIRHESTGMAFDKEAREARQWFFADPLIVAGAMEPGTTKRLELDLESTNPAARGSPVREGWNAVTSASCAADPVKFRCALAEAKPDGDFVRVAIDFTVEKPGPGLAVVPVTVTTGSGSGVIPVAVLVR